MMDTAENLPCVVRVMVLGSAVESNLHVLPLLTCICGIPLCAMVPRTFRRALGVEVNDFKQAAITSPVCTTNCRDNAIEVCLQGGENVPLVCDAL